MRKFKISVAGIFMFGGYIFWILFFICVVLVVCSYRFPMFKYNLPNGYVLKYARNYVGTLADAKKKILIENVGGIGFCDSKVYGWTKKNEKYDYFIADTKLEELTYPAEGQEYASLDKYPMGSIYQITELFNGDMRRIGLKECPL